MTQGRFEPLQLVPTMTYRYTNIIISLHWSYSLQNAYMYAVIGVFCGSKYFLCSIIVVAVLYDMLYLIGSYYNETQIYHGGFIQS